MKTNKKIVNSLIKKPYGSKLKNINKNDIQEKTRRGSYILSWLFDSYSEYQDKEEINFYIFGDVEILDEGRWFGVVARVLGFKGHINLNYIGNPKHVKSGFDVPSLGNVSFFSHPESMEELWNGIEEDTSILVGLEMRVTQDFGVASFMPAVMEKMPILMTFKTESQAIAYKDLFTYHGVNTGGIYDLSKINALSSIKAFEVYSFNGSASLDSELSEESNDLVNGLMDSYLNEVIFLKNNDDFTLDLTKDKDLFSSIENIVGEFTDEEDGVSFFILPDGFLLSLKDYRVYKMNLDETIENTGICLPDEMILKLNEFIKSEDKKQLIYLAYSIKSYIATGELQKVAG